MKLIDLKTGERFTAPAEYGARLIENNLAVPDTQTAPKPQRKTAKPVKAKEEAAEGEPQKQD